MLQNLWWYPRSSPFPREGFHGHDRLFQADPVPVSGIRSFSVRSVFFRHPSQDDGGRNTWRPSWLPTGTVQGRLVSYQQAKPPCLVDPRNRFDAAGTDTESLRFQDRPGLLVDHPVTVDQNCTQFFRFFHSSWLSSIFRSSFGLSASSSTLAKKFFHSRPSFSKSLRNPSVSRW